VISYQATNQTDVQTVADHEVYRPMRTLISLMLGGENGRMHVERQKVVTLNSYSEHFTARCYA